MSSRKAKESGPVYGMVAFVGSRQPEGPSPRALELLNEAKLRGPATAPAPEPVSAPVAVTKTTDPKPSLSQPADEPARAIRHARTRPRRPKSTPSDDYTLPPPGAGKPKTRSNHFRLPADVEQRLTELATTHGCSRTRVVCAAITSEWQRLRRRKTRAVQAGQT